ncbi:MAG: hypothetical protein JW829_06555 [Pirellulales bacterium]|nr:hypothetical protein [Pirellulales bacterium]
MIKKLLLVTAGVALLAVILFGRNAASYVSTSYDRVTETVRNSVPVEFQIDRARNMVNKLDDEIKRCSKVVAKEEVELEMLNKRIQTAEERNEKDKTNVLRLQADLSSNQDVYHYAGQTYTESEVKQDLSRRFERFKTASATLRSLCEMRDARQRNLDAASKKVRAIIATQRQLQVEIENLEAKRKLVEVAQASSDFIFDDSKLARAKELIGQIRTDLEVTAKLANAELNFHDEIPLDEPTAEDIEQQVAEYFELSGPKDAEFAKASYNKGKE